MRSVVDTYSNMRIMVILFFSFIRSSILILVSPNPSLATKPSMIPWSGQIYILGDSGAKVHGLLGSCVCNSLFYLG